jgi:hypothetical protein
MSWPYEHKYYGYDDEYGMMNTRYHTSDNGFGFDGEPHFHGSGGPPFGMDDYDRWSAPFRRAYQNAPNRGYDREDYDPGE